MKVCELSDRELIIAVSKALPGPVIVASQAIIDGRRDIVERMYTLGIVGSSMYVAYKEIGDGTLSTLYDTIMDADIKEKLAALGY